MLLVTLKQVKKEREKQSLLKYAKVCIKIVW